MYCHECGTELPSDAKHCTSCGNPVQEAGGVSDEPDDRVERTGAVGVEQRRDRSTGADQKRNEGGSVADRQQTDAGAASSGQRRDTGARSDANRGAPRQTDDRNQTDAAPPNQGRKREQTRQTRTGESNSHSEGLPIVGGLLYGSLSFLASYVAVAGLLIAEAANDGTLESFLESDGGPSVVETIGWVLYSAHNVKIVTPFREGPINLLENTPADAVTIPKIAFYAVPVVVLVAFGVALARRTSFDGRPTGIDSAKTGAALAVGYLACTVVGAKTVFSYDVAADVSATAGSIEPQLGPAVAVMGLAYPVVVGGIGGYLAGD